MGWDAHRSFIELSRNAGAVVGDGGCCCGDICAHGVRACVSSDGGVAARLPGSAPAAYRAPVDTLGCRHLFGFLCVCEGCYSAATSSMRSNAARTCGTLTTCLAALLQSGVARSLTQDACGRKADFGSAR